MNGLIGDFVQEAILEYSTAFTFDSVLRNRYWASIVIYDVHSDYEWRRIAICPLACASPV